MDKSINKSAEEVKTVKKYHSILANCIQWYGIVSKFTLLWRQVKKYSQVKNDHGLSLTNNSSDWFSFKDRETVQRMGVKYGTYIVEIA